MKVAVLDINGKDTGRKADLSKDVFAIEPNNHAVYLDVKQYLANQRQGTHKAKERAEITGSTRKIKKQKGTGTARAGSIKSGVFVGGGRIATITVEAVSLAANGSRGPAGVAAMLQLLIPLVCYAAIWLFLKYRFGRFATMQGGGLT